MKRADDLAVLRSTAKLIEHARGVVPSYAEGFGGKTGYGSTPSNLISDLLAEHQAVVDQFRFSSDAKGMAFAFGDERVIALDSASPRSDELYTIRHELAHILADEVQYALFLTSEDTMSFSERRADLFAVADLCTTRWITWMRGRGRPWKYLTLDIVTAFRHDTEGWSEQRLWDRARLRVQLYREFGI